MQNPPDGTLSFGHFPLHCRFNIDQMGIEFDSTAASGTWATHQECSQNHVQIRGGKSGWEKRAATWQVCLSADLTGPQPMTAVIFKGAGRVSETERLGYHPSVHVMFNERAWLDRPINKKWTEEVWGPFVLNQFRENEGVLLTSDSVDPQRLLSWKQRLASLRTTHLLGECNYTHVWQGVDRHVGKTLKHLFRALQLDWLAVDENWKAYPTLPAWKRRVLLTQWIGDAFDIYKKDYVEKHTRCYRSSGLLIRLDKKGDSDITVESDPTFQVQPFCEWPGLVEGISRQYLDDLEEEVELKEVESSSCDSSSDSSVDDVDQGPEADASDTDVVAAVVAQPEQHAEQIQEADPIQEHIAQESLRGLLENCKARGKIQQGIRHLQNLAYEKVCLQHPLKFKGMSVLMSDLEQVVASMGEVLPELWT